MYGRRRERPCSAAQDAERAFTRHVIAASRPGGVTRGRPGIIARCRQRPRASRVGAAGPSVADAIALIAAAQPGWSTRQDAEGVRCECGKTRRDDPSFRSAVGRRRR